MNLIIDIGNTRVKAAVFENNRLVELCIFTEEELVDKVTFFVSKYAVIHGILSSVKVLREDLMMDLQCKLPFLILDVKTKVPFINKYKTKETLGVDRIALVSNAAVQFPKKNVLIIDAGTCITYDYLSATNTYFGGAISPGIEMRYSALHNFTSKLPKLDKSIPKNSIGTTTNENIHSGVVYGVLNEIEGVIRQYEKEKSILTIVLTGGDTYFLAKQLKSIIFANPNFVLEGLNTILIHNKKEC
jgi:type III pantothenate kinase